MKEKTLRKKIEEVLEAIPQAEQIVKDLEPLANSSDSRERMKFLSAKLDLASLKNDLANYRALLTLNRESIVKEPGLE